MKKKGLITIIAIIAVIVIAIGSLVGKYNSLVENQQKVETAWSQISVYLQSRADKIPNLVNTVKGYTDYEQSTLQAVTEARSAVSKANGVNEQIEASNKLDSAVDSWVNAVTEAYPELKANTQFTALIDELTGSENRIATARKDYNDAAKEYNTKIKKFPTNIIAGMFGFEAYDYFEADATAQSVPQVNFD